MDDAVSAAVAVAEHNLLRRSFSDRLRSHSFLFLQSAHPVMSTTIRVRLGDPAAAMKTREGCSKVYSRLKIHYWPVLRGRRRTLRNEPVGRVVAG